MIKNETNNGNFEDYICFSLRKKNDIFHRKYVNKILYYDIMNSLINDDERKHNNFFLQEDMIQLLNYGKIIIQIV